MNKKITNVKIPRDIILFWINTIHDKQVESQNEDYWIELFGYKFKNLKLDGPEFNSNDISNEMNYTFTFTDKIKCQP